MNRYCECCSGIHANRLPGFEILQILRRMPDWYVTRSGDGEKPGKRLMGPPSIRSLIQIHYGDKNSKGLAQIQLENGADMTTEYPDLADPKARGTEIGHQST